MGALSGIQDNERDPVNGALIKYFLMIFGTQDRLIIQHWAATGQHPDHNMLQILVILPDALVLQLMTNSCPQEVG